MNQPKVFSEKCNNCVFHTGNRMHLRPGRLAQLVRDNQREGTALICHKTTYGQRPDLGEVVCRGFYDAYGESINVIRVMNRLGGFAEVAPPEDHHDEEN